MNKKIGIIFGLLGLLIISGINAAYVGTEINCSTWTYIINQSGYYYLNQNYTDLIYTAIKIEADNVVIDGLGHTLDGGSYSNIYGIEINGHNNITIKNIIIKEFGNGIYSYSSSNNTINNITTKGNFYSGIYLYNSSYNIISNVNTNDNNNSGILLNSSSNNTISNITANDNNYGIYLYSSNYNTLFNNNFKNNGMFVYNSYNNNISNNNVNGKNLVYLENKENIIINDSNTGQVILVNCNNITVKNLDLSNASIGLELYSSSNNIISNITANCNYYGIYLDSLSNNIISNIIASENDYGIYLYSSDDNKINNVNAIDNSWRGIYLESSSNNSISNITANDNYRGIQLHSSSNNNKVSNVDVSDNNDCGIYLYSSSNNTIGDITASKNNYGIYLYSSSNNTIGDITANNNSECGIQLYSSSSNNKISNITANDNNYYGIDLYSSPFSSPDNNIISNITANGNGYFGIRLITSSNNMISNVNVSDNKYYGIYLYSSSNNTISNITANDNNYGIYLYSSNYNTLFNNNFKNNGMFVYDSYNNNISNNNVNGKNLVYLENKENIIINDSNTGQVILVNCNNITVKNLDLSNASIGLELYSSSNNMIYLNNFINNIYSIFSYNSQNNNFNSPSKLKYLFNGTIHENYLGNYYSDYSGNDDDNDGIGDTSYTNGGIQDNYPLIKTFENYIFNFTYFNLTNISAPNNTLVNTQIQINVSIENIGTAPGNTTIYLYDGNNFINSTTVQLDNGTNTTVFFNYTPTTIGEHTLIANISNGDSVNTTIYIRSIPTTQSVYYSSSTSHHHRKSIEIPDTLKSIKSEVVRSFVSKAELLLGTKTDLELSGKEIKENPELVNEPIEIKSDCILVGGPVANPTVKKYINYFPVKVTNNYPGAKKGVIEKQIINGHTVILLAGSDRWGTKAAVEYFKTMDDLPDNEVIIVEWEGNGKIKVVSVINMH